MRTSAPGVDRDTQARPRSAARTRGGGAAETVRRLQQTAGNRAVVRWLAREGIRRPEERFPRLMEGGLQLDPELMRSVLRPILSAENLLDHLAEARPSTSRALAMRDPRRPSPTRPPPDPADPPGFERPAERAGASTFLSAVKAVPEVKRALENVEYQVWGRLSSGDRTTLVTTGISFGAAALGGMLATPGGREMLGKLSGIPLTVPKAPWLRSSSAPSRTSSASACTSTSGSCWAGASASARPGRAAAAGRCSSGSDGSSAAPSSGSRAGARGGRS